MTTLLKPYLLIPIHFLLAGLTCEAQQLTPLDVTRSIFQKNAFPKMQKYVTGEYEGHPNGDDLKNGVTTSLTLLNQTDSSAVVSVTLSGKNDLETDWYYYFKRDTIWKVYAFRALALTGMIEMAYNQLKALTPKQVDKIIAEPHSKARDNRMFKSKEDYTFNLRNLGLTLSSDRRLIAYFNEHASEFNALKSLVMANSLRLANNTEKDKPDAVEKKMCRALFLNRVFFHPGDVIDFNIGGVVDNTLGYLYVADKNNLPEISPDGYIMLREIGHGWYLYKTT